MSAHVLHQSGPSDAGNQVHNLTLARMLQKVGASAATQQQQPSSDGGSVTLLSFLRHATQHEMQVLDLRGAQLTPYDMLCVKKVISSHPTICALDLRGIPLTSLDARALLDAAQTNQFLTTVLMDDALLKTNPMKQLMKQLQQNRSYAKEERRRRWIEEERALHSDSVAAFTEFMTTFFVTEMRQRRELEELEWARRVEHRKKALSHHRRMLFRQSVRRMMEMVLELVVILVEREDEFRIEVRRGWAKGYVRLCNECESGARTAITKEDVVERQLLKQESVKDWVQARRKEKARKDAEHDARVTIHDKEKQERDKRLAEASIAFVQILQLEGKCRDQAIAAEGVRLEKERREAIQRRKDADAAKERKEKEEREHHAYLVRLRTEHRRERERLEGDAVTSRRRHTSDQSTAWVQLMNQFDSETTLMKALVAFIAAHSAVRHLATEHPVTVVMTVDRRRTLTQTLEDLLTSPDVNGAITFTLAPKFSFRFEAPATPQWTSQTTEAVQSLVTRRAALEEALGVYIRSSEGGHSAATTAAAGEREDVTGPFVSQESEGAMSLAVPPVTTTATSPNVAPLATISPVGTGLWSPASMRQRVEGWLQGPFAQINTLDDVMWWKTNILSVTLTFHMLAPHTHCKFQVHFDPQVLECINATNLNEDVQRSELQPSQQSDEVHCVVEGSSLHVKSKTEAGVQRIARRSLVSPMLQSAMMPPTIASPLRLEGTQTNVSPPPTPAAAASADEDDAELLQGRARRGPGQLSSVAIMQAVRAVTATATGLRVKAKGGGASSTMMGRRGTVTSVAAPAMQDIASLQMSLTVGDESARGSSTVTSAISLS